MDIIYYYDLLKDLYVRSIISLIILKRYDKNDNRRIKPKALFMLF